MKGNAIKLGQIAHGKNLTKAKNRLAERRAGYEEACKHRADNGRGLKRPGSLKVR